MFPFDPRGANEKGFPWETNYARINPEYFNAADERIRYLVEKGFTPCIVGAWGYFLPWMGVEKAKQHWRNLVARYGAWPVVWCVAGENNLPWYLAKNFPYDDREQVHGWTEVARYLRATDPFQRLMTIHPTGLGKLNARGTIDDAALLDFDMLQTPHGQRDAVAPTVAACENAFNLKPAMPMLSGEASYEMLSDQIPAQWSRAMFWLCMMNGAAGHTYGANGIWQCNRREQPHGPSPHHNGGVGYGKISWDDAMRLPGSQQIGDAKKFLEKFPWQKCVPQPESVAWAPAKKVEWKNWIWFPEGEPAQDAPIAPRFFRLKFALPYSAAELKRATLHVGVDNRATIWLDAKKIGECSGWEPPQQFDITEAIGPRNNTIAIRAENLSAPVKLNPAGLILSLQCEFADGKTFFIHSDSEWRASREEIKNWQWFNFDDSNWPRAKVVAPFGGGPWGKFDNIPSAGAPFAIGVEDQLRMIYSLEPRPVIVKNLRPNANYRLTRFNPGNGQREKETRIVADQHGQWLCPDPGYGGDWVMALVHEK